jgi:hypothetical protein
MVSWTRLAAGLAWLAWLLVLGLGEEWRALATPTVRAMALAGAGALALILLGALRGGVQRDRPAWPDGWSFAIAALPLLLLLRAGIPGLDHTSAAGRQAITIAPVEAAPAAPAATAPAEPGAPAAPAPPVGPVDLDRLRVGPGEVVVEAMLVRAAGRFGYLLPITGPSPPERTVLLRYRIICCAADATPVAVAVTGVPPDQVANGSWIRVHGTVDSERGGILVRAGSWHTITEPADPFLNYDPSAD